MLPCRQALIVSYYTPDYADEAAGLRSSLDLHGLEHDIRAIDDRGGWHANTSHKPTFLRRITDEHRRPLAWVDADARMQDEPRLFCDLERDGYDVAFHRLRGYEVCSGTVWLNGSRGARALVFRWQQVQSRYPELIDQQSLALALQQTPGLKVAELPPGYCYIYDTSRAVYPHERIVIEHFQASRRKR